MSIPFSARLFTSLAALLLVVSGPVSAEPTPDLQQIMANPDWIGNAPTNPWWDATGDAVYYKQKRDNEDFSDTFRLSLSASTPEKLANTALAQAGATSQVHTPDRRLTGWIYEGDVYLRDQLSGTVKAITSTVSKESRVVFSVKGDALFFERDKQIYQYNLSTGLVRQVSQIIVGKDPDATPEFDVLRQQQLSTYTTLADDKRRRDGVKDHQRDTQPTLPDPLYLGDEVEILQQHMSPDGVHLALVHER